MFEYLFRSFLPLYNPIGFGASDWVELFVALLIVALMLLRHWIEPLARKLAERPGWSMLALALLPVVLRLALLPSHPIPVPRGADDFSYILLGDTLAHFRLANPPHPLHQFFEGVFTLQEPTYSSMYPLGQGIVLALGQLIFGLPWAGVVLSIAAMCALCYWMLRAWVPPLWALAGGVLAALEFGPLSQWMNCYWGGAVAACSGCLVFGALPRLRENWRTRDAALLGAGMGIQVITRPFESIFMLLGVLMFFAPAARPRKEWGRLARAAAISALVASPVIPLILFHNKAVTGSWTTLPYQLSRYQYGIPQTFTFQPNPVPHKPLTMEQQQDYRAQVTIHGNEPLTLGGYLGLLGNSVRYYRFFFLPALYLALPVFLITIRQYRFLWVVLCLLIYALGTNFDPYLWPHYIAAILSLCLLMSVKGLERLSEWKPVGRQVAAVILLLCAAHFGIWYGLHATGSERLMTGLGQYETWDYINWGDPEGRIQINERLAEEPGRQLVFIRYWPSHRFRTWTQNAADIDRARVVWALDLGPSENEKLLRYYPDRTAWLLEPDARPPQLTPYRQEPKPEQPLTDANPFEPVK